MSEIWKDVVGYKDRYKVSSYGRVKSFVYNQAKYKNTGKILSPAETHNGYLFVILTKNNNPKTKRISRLVAKAFIPNPHNKRTVNHKDGNKKNNHVSNLEWATHSENIKHAYDNGLHDPLNGTTHPNSILDATDIIDIRNAYRLGCFTYKEIAESYGVSSSTVRHAINKLTWKHI